MTIPKCKCGCKPEYSLIVKPSPIRPPPIKLFGCEECNIFMPDEKTWCELMKPYLPVWNKARYKLPEIDQRVICILKENNSFAVLYYDSLFHNWKGNSTLYRRNEVLLWCEIPTLPEDLK